MVCVFVVLRVIGVVERARGVETRLGASGGGAVCVECVMFCVYVFDLEGFVGVFVYGDYVECGCCVDVVV